MNSPPAQPGRVALTSALAAVGRQLAGISPGDLDGRRVRMLVGGVVLTLSARAAPVEGEHTSEGPPKLPVGTRRMLTRVFEAVWRLRTTEGGASRKVWPRDVADEIARVHGKKSRPAISTVSHALAELVDEHDRLRRVNGYDLKERGLF